MSTNYLWLQGKLSNDGLYVGNMDLLLTDNPNFITLFDVSVCKFVQILHWYYPC